MSGRMPVSDSPVDAADIGVADERPDPDLDQVVTAGPAGPLSARNAAIAVGLVVAALIAGILATKLFLNILHDVTTPGARKSA